MPGLFGGLVALLFVPGIAKAQLSGIVITVVIASVTGLIAGFAIKATGEKVEAYED
jgi:ammonium transporter Rh